MMNPEIYSLFENTAVKLVKEYRRREEESLNKNELSQSNYLTTGIPELDQVITGFRPGDLICFHGDGWYLPKFIVHHMLQHLCEEHGKVLLLSAGMPAINIIQEVIDYYQYDSSFINIKNYDSIEKHELIAKMPLYIEDAPYLNIDTFIEEIKGSHHQLKFIVIDDIAVFLNPCNDEFNIQEMLLADIIDRLKRLTIDLGIVIIISPIYKVNNLMPMSNFEELAVISYSYMFKKSDRVLYVQSVDNNEEPFDETGGRDVRIINLKSYKIDKENRTDTFTIGNQTIKIEQTITL